MMAEPETSDGTRRRAAAEDWRPTASIAALRLRARILTAIRNFFAERGVLEVETPLLGAATATSPHLRSLKTRCRWAGEAAGHDLYLQTSPEAAMKRLLAAGSGPIFQICKAFRDGETGPLHNPEFSLLEWYRPGFDALALMNEVEALLERILHIAPVSRVTYREAFRQHAHLDPFAVPLSRLRRHTMDLGLARQTALSLDRDACLDLILTHQVQPCLGQGATWIRDFPVSQAQLARVRVDTPPVAERFELFIGGIELANGYLELVDSAEQRKRCLADIDERRRLGLPEVPLDRRLLQALEHGLPACSGIALGIDRLAMLAAKAAHLQAVLPFPVSRA